MWFICKTIELNIFSHIWRKGKKPKLKQRVCSIAACDQYRNFTAAAFYFIDMLQIFCEIIAGTQCCCGLELKHLSQIFCFWCCRQKVHLGHMTMSAAFAAFMIRHSFTVWFFSFWSNIFPVINVSMLSFTEW